jgi:hypothetical protein
MAENGSDLVLDGNAAAGLLQQIFVAEITNAQIQCEACGFTGAVRLFLRCTHCDSILMRVAHTPHGRWLDMTGARHLRF